MLDRQRVLPKGKIEKFFTLELANKKAIETDVNGHVQLRPVFAYDTPVSPNQAPSGKKAYVVADYDTMLQHMQALPLERRTFYEVLLTDLPCHIYIDIEVERSFNEQIDPDAVTEAFTSAFLAYIDVHPITRGIPCRMEEMDSSSANKYSKHYLAKLEGHMLASNYCVGALMRGFERWLSFGGKGWIFADKEHTMPDPSALHAISASDRSIPGSPMYAWKDDSKQKRIFVVDLSVYTRRRLFRLLGNTKLNKNRPLVHKDQLSELDPAVFARTLVQYTPVPVVPLHILEWNGSEPKSTSDLHKHMEDVPEKTYERNRVASRSLKRTWDETQPDTLVGCAEIVSDMIERYHAPKVRQTSVRGLSITLFCEGRWCENVKREHESNHVWYYVNLTSFTYHQCCFVCDPYTLKIATLRVIPEPYLSKIKSIMGDDAPLDLDGTIQMHSFWLNTGLVMR